MRPRTCPRRSSSAWWSCRTRSEERRVGDWSSDVCSSDLIDWVATDEAEATRMLDFAVAAIQRKVAYADLMEQVDDDKVPSSAEIPHIIVISDETADLPAAVKQRLVELSN